MRLRMSDEQEGKLAPIAFFIGAAMLGLSGGEFLYWVATGRRAGNSLTVYDFPYAAFFLLAETWIVAASRHPLLRAAFALDVAVRFLSLLTPLGASGTVPWLARQLFRSLFGALLLLFGARLAAPTTRLRIVAAILLVAAVPLRYWAIKQYDDLLRDLDRRTNSAAVCPSPSSMDVGGSSLRVASERNGWKQTQTFGRPRPALMARSDVWQRPGRNPISDNAQSESHALRQGIR